MDTESLERNGWRNALLFLDRYIQDPTNDLTDLSRVVDDPAFSVYDCHKKRLLALFKNGKVNLMEIYSELVQMLLNDEKEKYKGFVEAFNVHKIEGYNYLTTRMQNRVNDRFHNEFIGMREQMKEQQKMMVAMGNKIERCNDEIKQLKNHEVAQDAEIKALQLKNMALEEKVEELESKQKELDRDQKILAEALKALQQELKRVKETIRKFMDDVNEKFRLIEEELRRVRGQLTTLEKDVKWIKDQIRGLDDKDEELERRIESLLSKIKETVQVTERFPQELQKQISLVKESIDEDSHPALEKVKEMMDDKVKVFTDELDKIKDDIIDNGDLVEKRAKELREKIDGIQEKQKDYVKDNEEKINIIKGDVDDIKKEKDELSNLLQKLKLLQTDVDDHKKKMGDINVRIDHLPKVDLKDIEHKVEVNKVNIDWLKADQERQDGLTTQLRADFVRLKDKTDKKVDELRKLNEQILEEIKDQVGKKMEEQDKRIAELEKKKKELERDLLVLNGELDNLLQRVVKLEEKDFKKILRSESTHIKNELLEQVNFVKQGVDEGELEKLKIMFETYRDFMWALIMRMYAVFRCYTVIISSTGEVKAKLPLALGVYRLIGSWHSQPYFKKDGAEMYLYYNEEVKAWLVGPDWHSKNAWLKNEDFTFPEDHASTMWNELRKVFPDVREYLLPDLRSKWKYQPLDCRKAGLPSGHCSVAWKDDDHSLGVSYIKDVETIIDYIEALWGIKHGSILSITTTKSIDRKEKKPKKLGKEVSIDVFQSDEKKMMKHKDEAPSAWGN